MRVRGTALETRRLLRPVLAPARALWGWVAPHITRGLLFVIKLLAALIALITELGTVTVRWLVSRGTALATATWELAQRYVTPLSTVAFVGLAAAVGLGVSQFFDYHSVRRCRTFPTTPATRGVVAPLRRSREPRRPAAPASGSCCRSRPRRRWLIVATYLGRPRLAGAVALCGAARDRRHPGDRPASGPRRRAPWPCLLRRPGRAASGLLGRAGLFGDADAVWRPAGALLSWRGHSRRDGGGRERPSGADHGDVWRLISPRAPAGS